jgi:hypothetical protein
MAVNHQIPPRIRNFAAIPCKEPGAGVSPAVLQSVKMGKIAGKMPALRRPTFIQFCSYNFGSSCLVGQAQNLRRLL